MSEKATDSRVVIVTGAGGVLGRAHAMALSARGMSVVVNDLGNAMEGAGHSQGPADAVVQEIRSAGGSAVASYGDVSSLTGARDIVATAIDTFGRLDAVVNNAGTYLLGPFDEVPVEDFRALVDVHLFGTINVSQAAWPYLKSSGSGRIVNTVSLGIFGHDRMAAYSTAKAAIFGLTKCLAIEGASSGITVNNIVPAVASRMAEHYADYFSISRDVINAENMPPEPVAAVAALLASAESSESGLTYSVSGGRVSVIEFIESSGTELSDLSSDAVAAAMAQARDLTSASIRQVALSRD